MPTYINRVDLPDVVPSFTFPGGEIQVNVKDYAMKKLGDYPFKPQYNYQNVKQKDGAIKKVPIYYPPSLFIDSYLYNSDDIMELFLILDALKDYSEGIKYTHIYLQLFYLPYARQDRVCNEGECFSLKTFIKLLGSIIGDGFSLGKVGTDLTVVDVHSHVTLELLEKYVRKDNISITINEITRAQILKNFMLPTMEEGCLFPIVSPDKGAVRINKECRKLGLKTTKDLLMGKYHYFFEKKRNSETGEIEGMEMINPSISLNGLSVIILDDICDGGRTFIECAKILKEKGAAHIYLYVTHGIFSKGLDVLRPYFAHVFCYHVWPNVKLDDDYLTVYDTKCLEHHE